MKALLIWKRVLCSGLLCGLLGLAVGAHAQSTPGWGWAKGYGEATSLSTEESAAVSVGTDAAGNVYVLGHFVAISRFDAATIAISAGETDVYLAKYTPAGALAWARVLAGTGTDLAGRLVVSATGRCVITGTYGAGPTGGDLVLPDGQALQGPRQYGAPIGNGHYGCFPFVICYDAQGATQWISRPSPTYFDYPPGVEVDGVGNVYLTGVSLSAMTVNGQTYPAIGYYDSYVIKLNASGLVQWARRVGMPFASVYGGVRLDKADNLYWQLASNYAGTTSIDGRPLAFGGNGRTLQVKISGQNSVKWVAGDMVTWTGTTTGYYYAITGYDRLNNAFLFETRALGGSSAHFRGSTTVVTTPAGSMSSLIGRIDTSGNVTAAGIWASSNPPSINRMLTDAAGELTLVGQVYGDYTLASTGQSYANRRGQVMVTRLSANLQASSWTRFAEVNATFANPGAYNDVKDAALDAQGNVYVAGRFLTTARFGAFILTPSWSGFRSDGFLAKLDMTVVSATRAALQGRAWAAYPNPASGAVQLSGLPAHTLVQLTDLQGRVVREVRTGAASVEQPLSLTGLATGVYTLLVTGTAEPYRPQKLLVE